MHLKYLSNDHILPPVIYLDSKPLSSALEKADAFNKYFNSIFTVSDFSLPPVQELPTPANKLSNISIEPSDVYQALSNLKFKFKKSPGCDNICPQLHLLCLHPLLHIITYISVSTILLNCQSTSRMENPQNSAKLNSQKW